MNSKIPYDSDVKLQPKVEAFAEYRDNIMRRFRISRKTMMGVSMLFVVIPLFLFAKVKDSQLKQYKLEQREITHLVNVANILRENPQRKPKFDYEGVFAEAEKGEEAGERTQFNTGIYVSKYHMLPTDQRVQRETKIYQ